ncbi:MAG TPA: hypothetical protein PLV45_03875, partial [bacterium]|nr:hypothetical protein [bacterium]
PIEKISDKFLSSILDRMTTVHRELGRAIPVGEFLSVLTSEFEKSLSITLDDASLTDHEETLRRDVLSYYASDEWIEKIRIPPDARVESQGLHKAPGGLIRVIVILDQRNRQIQSAMISGDFFAREPRLLLDMEARLKGSSTHPGRIRWSIHQVLHGHEDSIPGVTADDFTQAVLKALRSLSIMPEKEPS